MAKNDFTRNFLIKRKTAVYEARLRRAAVATTLARNAACNASIGIK